MGVAKVPIRAVMATFAHTTTTTTTATTSLLQTTTTAPLKFNATVLYLAITSFTILAITNTGPPKDMLTASTSYPIL